MYEEKIIHPNFAIVVILHLAPDAKIFRQFVNCALRRHLQRNESRAEEKLVWLFKKDQDYWLN
jgi:hypothetical protein